MGNEKRQSAGGKANAVISRQKSLDRYYSNPSCCLECESVILIRDGERASEVKKKRFCNRNCSAKYNNRLFPKKKKTANIVNATVSNITNTTVSENKCKLCDLNVKKSSTYCISCCKNRGISDKTKKELFELRKNWQSAASSIRKQARVIYAKASLTMKCKLCGYDKHVQICHIKSVSDFCDSAQISEINALENLVALCPNHHWEFDSGLISVT